MALPVVIDGALARIWLLPMPGTRGSGPDWAKSFLARINASFDAIEQFPGRFAVVHGEVRRAFVSRFPYAVFFQVEPSRVVILTVLHTARDSKLWPRSGRTAR
jgi:plasmid stabilization system protein ParE